jgi:hypothetical protein
MKAIRNILIPGILAAGMIMTSVMEVKAVSTQADPSNGPTIPILTMPGTQQTTTQTPTTQQTSTAQTPATQQPALSTNTVPAQQIQAVQQPVITLMQDIQLPKINPDPVTSRDPVVTAVAGTTSPVTVDLIIFAGQSNMSGNGGNAKLAPAVAPGQGYEYRPTSSPNALYPLAEPFGRNERGYLSDMPMFQGGTLVSAFVNSYYAKTGVPVVAVPATKGGTESGFWANGATKADLISRFNKAKAYLEKNNFKVRKKYLVFMQGENDAVKGVDTFVYKNNLTSAFQPLLANGLDQVFIITPGYAGNGTFFYDDVVNAQIDLCNSNNMFTLASSVLHNPAMNKYLADSVHYNQLGLNLAGQTAGAKAGAFACGGM